MGHFQWFLPSDETFVSKVPMDGNQMDYFFKLEILQQIILVNLKEFLLVTTTKKQNNSIETRNVKCRI